ncbi:DUF4286 family protein [Parabacteroides sp. OttesenSCG-928-G07]|jgi:hypothetical protein|nr:DUF4286 family protein [Parabacteroides sp. OttesenSCG-928-G07]
MIVYNTTFQIDRDILDDCLTYIKEEYLPAAIASGSLSKPVLRRILHAHNEEGESYAVQFHVANTDVLNQWLSSEGNRIVQALVDHFGDKIVGFTTLLEEIEWEKG